MTAEATLLILGASGDLTSRLLLPALGQLLKRESWRRVHLRGAGMDDWDGPDLMSLELNVNGNDNPFELSKATMVAELGEGALRAYGEVLSGHPRRRRDPLGPGRRAGAVLAHRAPRAGGVAKRRGAARGVRGRFEGTGCVVQSGSRLNTGA